MKEPKLQSIMDDDRELNENDILFLMARRQASGRKVIFATDVECPIGEILFANQSGGGATVVRVSSSREYLHESPTGAEGLAKKFFYELRIDLQ